MAYLDLPNPLFKALQIVRLMDGEIVPQPARFADVPLDKCLVWVVSRGASEWAFVCHDERQFKRTVHKKQGGTRSPHDLRPGEYLLVPWDKVVENLGFDPRPRGPQWVM